MESIVLLFVNLLAVYVLLGVLFSLWLLWRGLTRIDPGTEGVESSDDESAAACRDGSTVSGYGCEVDLIIRKWI